jgi:hypothetical protein
LPIYNIYILPHRCAAVAVVVLPLLPLLPLLLLLPLCCSVQKLIASQSSNHKKLVAPVATLRILRFTFSFVTRPTGYSHGSPRAVVCYRSLGLVSQPASFHFLTF